MVSVEAIVEACAEAAINAQLLANERRSCWSPVDTDSPEKATMKSPAKVEGTPSRSPERPIPFALEGVPTPLRNRESQTPCKEQSVCVLDACPWDALAQSLTISELAELCCTSASHYQQLTIEESSVDESGGEQTQRKLLSPLLTLKAETAEVELSRVSLGNVRTLRIYNHRSLDLLAETVNCVGGPEVLRSLERIALKGCPLGQEVTSSFLLSSFTHSKIKHLNLERNQVTDDMICEFVESGALDATCLESINLRFNKIGSRGAQALASCACFATLKWVNLKLNMVGDDGAIALAEKLQSNSCMRLLNLRRQMPPLTDRTAIAFASVLKHNDTLEQLRFRQNRITDSGAEALANQVADHVRRLQICHGYGARFELDLEQNRIKDNGAQSLLQALKGTSEAVRVEILLAGNWAKQASLTKDEERDGKADPRLAFRSKAEGLVW